MERSNEKICPISLFQGFCNGFVCSVCYTVHKAQKDSAIFHETVFPQKQVYRDTIDCHIINKEGRLEGKNGISSTEVVAHLRTLQLQQGDSLTISIRHDMRRELLPGISDVGVKITGE
jgi:gliding motility-associated lipoprotein GldH